MQLAMSMRITLISLSGIVLSGFLAVAQPSGSPVGFTLPVQSTPASGLPRWMESPVTSTFGNLTTLSIPILPPGDAGEDLAVTVYFSEPADGFLRVLWATASKQITLAHNLYQGVAVPHRQTLLLPASLLTQAGVLTLQNDGLETTVYQIRFDRVYRDEVSVTQGAKIPDLIMGHGVSVDANELNAVPYRPVADRWAEDVINAAVTDRIERIEGGLDFVVPLVEEPLQARIVVRVAGLPFTGGLDLWINGAFVTTLAVDVPELNDPGYYHDGEGTWHYAGWRKAAAAVPAALLPEGDNVFHFAPSGVLPGEPVAIQDFILQLRYPVPQPPPAPPSFDLFGNPMEDDMDDDYQAPLPEFRFLISDPELNS